MFFLGSLGYDLCSAYDCSIPARGKGIVKTDLSIAIPPNTYARIAPRSGLAVKNFIGMIKTTFYYYSYYYLTQFGCLPIMLLWYDSCVNHR